MTGVSDQSLRRLADDVRSRPLGEVAPLLGYRRDPTDRSRWRRAGSVITVRGLKFYDHLQGCGGGGAIDLVVHGLDCSPVEAIRWLSGGPCVPEIEEPVAPTGARTLVLPEACEGCWGEVRSWLIEERGLEDFRIDGFKSAGMLYADARFNAVFVCRDVRGVATGAELVGSRRRADGGRFRGMAPGSRKTSGGFWFGSVDEEPFVGAFIAESAIDALSALTLGAGGLVSLHASVSGVCRRLPDWLGGFDLGFIKCGFDADEAGDAAAGALMASDGRVSRVRPPGAKDWNALLQRDGIWALIGGMPPDV